MENYTLVVTKKALGLYWHVRLISNYGKGIEEILMHSQNYYNKGNAIRAARNLAHNLTLPMVVEDEG